MGSIPDLGPSDWRSMVRLTEVEVEGAPFRQERKKERRLCLGEMQLPSKQGSVTAFFLKMIRNLTLWKKEYDVLRIGWKRIRCLKVKIQVVKLALRVRVQAIYHTFVLSSLYAVSLYVSMKSAFISNSKKIVIVIAWWIFYIKKGLSLPPKSTSIVSLFHSLKGVKGSEGFSG